MSPPDLSVTKTVDNDRPKEGESVVYSILVFNAAGGAQASNVIVSDSLPAGVTYVSDSPSQGTYSSGTGQWALGSLSSGASATLDITATVDAATIGQTLINTASILSLDQNDPNAPNDSDSASGGTWS